MSDVKSTCQSCGHERSEHVIDRDGKPYGLIDNLGTHGGASIYCVVQDPFHVPSWTSCGCAGYVERK